MIKSFSDLEVYQLSYNLAIDIFNVSKTFPNSENFARDCQYITSEQFENIYRTADEIGAMIHKLYISWK